MFDLCIHVYVTCCNVWASLKCCSNWLMHTFSLQCLAYKFCEVLSQCLICVMFPLLQEKVCIPLSCIKWLTYWCCIFMTCSVCHRHVHWCVRLLLINMWISSDTACHVLVHHVFIMSYKLISRVYFIYLETNQYLPYFCMLM